MKKKTRRTTAKIKSITSKRATPPPTASFNTAQAEAARELLNKRLVCFSTATGQAAREDRDGFRRLVDLAAEYGASHVAIGQIPFRYDNWVLPDNHDPYAAWCNHAAGLLRVCPPPELQPWVSQAHAEQIQEYIGWQLEVMRPYGLKGSTYAIEPMWLPEEVFRAHPAWRGTQCELARIARRPYFAPSIDEPEVLDLYRRAMRDYSERFPQVDHYSFMSNDSGGGIAWTPNVYPGINGPIRHRGRNGGARIAQWLAAIQEGAAEAGVKMRLHLHSSGFPPELIASAQAACEPGTFVNWGNGYRDAFNGPGAGLSAGLWSTPYPAKGLGSVRGLMSGLQSVYNRPEKPVGIGGVGMSEDDIDTVRMALEVAVDNPESGSVALSANLLRMAERFGGSAENAESLVRVWDAIDRATQTLQQVRQKGFGQVLAYAGVSMRWLTRPMVPRPEQLTKEELKYVTPCLFSNDPERDLSSFSYVLGKGVFRGESVTWMSRWCLQEAVSTLKGAEHTVRGMLKKRGTRPDGRKRLKQLADRIGVYACLALNARNTIMFQYTLDTAGQPQYAPNPADYDDNIIYDHRGLAMRKIARAELDNIHDLIGYLEKAPEGVIEHARAPHEESVFMLDADLVSALRHKSEVMMNHWQEYEDLYPATKVWDFEPPMVGNIVPAEKTHVTEDAE